MSFEKQKIYKDPKNVKFYGQRFPHCQACQFLNHDYKSLLVLNYVSVHHIIFGRSHPKDDRDSNLISICLSHHEAAHGKNGFIPVEIFLEIKKMIENEDYPVFYEIF